MEDKKREWYVYDGMVIDEKTGVTIALVRNDDDAVLLAAAPEMFDTLKECTPDARSACWDSRDDADNTLRYIGRVARAVIDRIENESKVVEKLDWSFDLTDFGDRETFISLLKDHNIDNEPEIVDTGQQYRYLWHSPNLTMETGNNPITGMYMNPKIREPEPGYASYIGITGEEDAVKDLADDIKDFAEFIKDEAPYSRSFI